MNKGRRNELTKLKYKKRVRQYTQSCHLYVNQEGKRIYDPKTVDIIKDNGFLIYKTSAVLCSCYGCSGYYKYKRHEKKLEDKRLINEALIGDL